MDNGHIVFDYLRDTNSPDPCPLRQYNFLFECIRNIYRDKSPDFLLLPFECFLFDSKVCTNALSLFLARDPDLHQIRRSLTRQNCDRYRIDYTNYSRNKHQLYSGEPESLASSRDKTLSNILQSYPYSDVNIFIEHIQWYHEFINVFSSNNS